MFELFLSCDADDRARTPGNIAFWPHNDFLCDEQGDRHEVLIVSVAGAIRGRIKSEGDANSKRLTREVIILRSVVRMSGNAGDRVTSTQGEMDTIT